LTQYFNERLNPEEGEFEDEIEEVDPIEDDPEVRARFIAEVAYSIKAEDITVLDLRGLTIIADFFLICTGNSSIQIRAIADRIEEKMREQGFRKLRVEGYQEASWILVDFGDVVIHVMAAEQREFYQLEKFWADAPRLELDLEPAS
jgi:ribosome-associated protein